MNKEHFKQWTDALRSGKYDQGRTMLRDTMNRFCCLGVGCEVAEIGYQCCDEYPPEEFWEWLGFYQNQLSFEQECVQMNDNDGMSFKEIADEIDRQVEKWR